MYRVVAGVALALALGSACQSPLGCHQPAPEPEPRPFLCHDRTGECFAIHSSCIMYMGVFGGDCFEARRAWCLRRQDLTERSSDPNMDCWVSHDLCARDFELHGTEEQCFTLDDASILHEHTFLRVPPPRDPTRP